MYTKQKRATWSVQELLKVTANLPSRNTVPRKKNMYGDHEVERL